MIDSNKKIEQLFDETKRIVRHQKEKEKLKGEKFNIFSILRVENMENKTHSAFLCELLNPNGTHLKGNIFLQLFLNIIENKKIDVESAKAKTEHNIGKRNDKEKKGGRIDVYIWDKAGNSISIENKIYANDQYAQIERYCNHHKGKNAVYYLNLFGEEPSEASRGTLKANEDYFVITYKKEILDWLRLCVKEAADAPILRESIRQYEILIKKLTWTMENSEQRELFDLLLKNYEEARIIAKNFDKAIGGFLTKIRKNVFNQLQKELQDKFSLELGDDVNRNYSQIWIKIKGKEKKNIYFGLESFAKNEDNVNPIMFIGIFNNHKDNADEFQELGEFNNKWWLDIKQISDYEGCKINMSNPETIKKLQSSSDFLNGFVNHIVKESQQYLDNNYERVLAFINKKTQNG